MAINQFGLGKCRSFLIKQVEYTTTIPAEKMHMRVKLTIIAYTMVVDCNHLCSVVL
jgi:hypothetical protein